MKMKNLFSAFLFPLFAFPAFAGPHGTFSPATVADVVAFSATSGATDKLNLARFEEPIRDWNIWGSMVCWPLCSAQNAGTGTTVYSFGGLGTYNGTLVNGPTWGATGVAFAAASSQWAEITPFTMGPSMTVIAVHAVTSSAASNGIIQYHIGAGYGTLWSNVAGVAYFDCLNSTTTRTNGALSQTNGVFYSHIGIGNASSVKQWKNGSTQISALASAADFSVQPTTIRLCSNVTGYSYTGTIAFVGVINASSATAAQIHSLYAATLGKGLGLP